MGATYILWEFRRNDSATVVMAFGYRANYPREHFANAARRTGAEIEFLETSGRKTASSHLHETVIGGTAAICTVDPYYLPYLQIPSNSEGCLGWHVNCIGVGDEVTLHDIGRFPRTLEAERFEKARGRIGSYKNRLTRVSRSDDHVDLGSAIVSAVGDCCDYLGSNSDSFGIRSIQKWSRLIADESHKKGWPVVFAGGRRLFGVLRTVYESIMFDQGGGGGMRDLYALFLREAGSHLAREEFLVAADAYDSCAAAWNSLAEAALPIDVFDEARALSAKRYGLIKEGNDEARAEESVLRDRIETFEQGLDREFPLDERGRGHIFETMQASLHAIYESEQRALQLLEKCR